MFTGLIEEVGRLRRVARQGQAMILVLEGSRVLKGVQIGDSISVNGVCLTVVAYDDSTFTVDVMPETFRHTTLSSLKPGAPVNLERAMAAGGRFGGHIVQGHVDTTAVILSRAAEDNAVVFRFSPHDPNTLKYIVPKGSITVDGISLTVVEATEAEFSVSIIPHTLAETILQHKTPGDAVNIECDVLGKYVERLLAFRGHEGAAGGRGQASASRLTATFLAENGFL
ncbi:riboflavin synthase subunit alpha [Paenibacillus sp. J31TS4]|uniref:riboflavin synthase n=1 Tax=Paenibacillus sp. J31TS4 TaxID=2807195 RepID=UPI001B284165|nr:riboflavin synthase [Paenibacillus sp. J31TS4]GIP37527.1 riboflavin synthase subunit alpha [Paenibacillus sp. J31TS4]